MAEKLAAIGDVLAVRTIGPYEIRKRVTRIAYARNGSNRPTVYYTWDLHRTGDRLLVTNLPTLREATALAGWYLNRDNNKEA